MYFDELDDPDEVDPDEKLPTPGPKKTQRMMKKLEREIHESIQKLEELWSLHSEDKTTLPRESKPQKRSKYKRSKPYKESKPPKEPKPKESKPLKEPKSK